MDPQDDGAAPLIVLDQMELPERLGKIQRGAHQISPSAITKSRPKNHFIFN
jgi:hypothetical protein